MVCTRLFGVIIILLACITILVGIIITTSPYEGNACGMSYFHIQPQTVMMPPSTKLSYIMKHYDHLSMHDINNARQTSSHHATVRGHVWYAIHDYIHQFGAKWPSYYQLYQYVDKRIPSHVSLLRTSLVHHWHRQVIMTIWLSIETRARCT
jgi:hypothetical protein